MTFTVVEYEGRGYVPINPIGEALGLVTTPPGFKRPILVGDSGAGMETARLLAMECAKRLGADILLHTNIHMSCLHLGEEVLKLPKPSPTIVIAGSPGG